jgi:hypothetical protein
MSLERKKAKPSQSKNIESGALLKQKMADIEHRMSLDVGALLVLISEGTPQQVILANQRTKSDLIKFGPDMQKIALEMGGKIPKIVDDYLDSIDSIVHSATGWIDEAKIVHCYNMTQKLQKELGLD